MKNTIQLLLTFTTLGLSLLVIQSYYNIVDTTVAQQQNETANQTQMQDQENMSERKFLKNSTSFGNATSELKIKHAPEFSTLTIQPWPIVEPSKEFNITGILVDKITLQPVANSDISFLYESASEAIPSFSLETIKKQTADTDGKFSTTVTAPDIQGIVSVTALYNGSGLYHSVASDPALAIVSNSSLPP